jgi:hypothetical protein
MSLPEHCLHQNRRRERLSSAALEGLTIWWYFLPTASMPSGATLPLVGMVALLKSATRESANIISKGSSRIRSGRPSPAPDGRFDPADFGGKSLEVTIIRAISPDGGKRFPATPQNGTGRHPCRPRAEQGSGGLGGQLTLYLLACLTAVNRDCAPVQLELRPDLRGASFQVGNLPHGGLFRSRSKIPA